MTYSVGTLVKTRGREWVVLPESEEDLLVLRPLGGTEDEVTGIYLPLEKVEPAQFSLPDPNTPGDYFSCRLLRDAIRLGFRSSAGPFRSFARIAVEPRPYQLVPLLMALRVDPVRILIADDVGIGKTIEAGLIARELLDRGEVRRLAVLCPPHLAEQWQTELYGKFHIDAELVLPSTASRLEKHCALNESLFDRFPHVIVSLDFIKSDRRRDDFLRACPELVIVDEAHTCSYAGEGRGYRHQRHRLVSDLAKDHDRHMILVTATPHSGKEEAFRSLLTLLNPEFGRLPEDLGGKANEHHRRRLAEHFVQRKRGDIQSYLGSETFFPEREDRESNYRLSADYKKLFMRAVRYARETVSVPGEGKFRQRVRWWSALALLRALASSPAAAAATLRNRAAVADTTTPEEADEVGRRTVLDILEDETQEGMDLAPGSDIEEGKENPERQRLLKMAREAEALADRDDNKLKEAIKILKDLLKDGCQPIVFCRFIQTAEYVAQALRQHLPRTVQVDAVTGTLPHQEREERVLQLSTHAQRVLVCTDCLSEGINLQDHFNAVFHYDLSWNPTRHEQREGRVDRYGQPAPKVRVVTFYGLDNQIDGIVLDVLIKKHRTIRSSLGISVPVPVDTNQVVEAIFEGLLLKESSGGPQQSPEGLQQTILPGFEKWFKPRKDALFKEWDIAVDREKRSRTLFAQHSIKVDEVAQELRAVQEAIGSGVEVADFTREALRTHGAVIHGNGSLQVDLSDPEVPAPIVEAMPGTLQFKARFELPVQEGEIYLNRTHPFVESLATHVMETALDPILKSVARRSGVIMTRLVERRTTLLLVRFRYHIVSIRGAEERPLLAEDCRLLGFSGSPENAQWIDPDLSQSLILAKPDGNISADRASYFLNGVLEGFHHLWPHLELEARSRGDELLEAHRRVRRAAQVKGVKHRVEPHLPPDVLGVYVYLPARQ
jgi:superfamily II DNA or RNA helicase